jgi:hypothetical protein
MFLFTLTYLGLVIFALTVLMFGVIMPNCPSATTMDTVQDNVSQKL